MTLIYFVLILGTTVFIHELGHFLFAKKAKIYCYEFSLGMGPKLYSFRRKNDETEYSIRLFPIGGYVKMAGEEVEEDKEIRADGRIQSKTFMQRFLTIVAGVTFNFLLGIVLLFFIGLIYGCPETKPYLGVVDKNYNAYKEGLRENDLILKVDNEKVYTWDDVLILLEMKDDTETLKLEYKNSNNEIKTIEIEPTKVDIDGSTNYVYGISSTTKVNHGFINSIKYASVKFASIYKSMITVITSLFTGKLGMDNLAGPVGIYGIVGEQAKVGFQNILYLISFLSINVGFVNLLPFPAFDGGRLVFLIIEKIRKKPVDSKIENIIHAVGFILLMILMLIITIQDIGRL